MTRGGKLILPVGPLVAAGLSGEGVLLSTSSLVVMQVPRYVKRIAEWLTHAEMTIYSIFQPKMFSDFMIYQMECKIL